MKYIRTKDGLGEWLSIDKCWHYSSSVSGKKRISIKEADTIEELCDEIVIDNPHNWRKTPFTIIVNITQYVKDLKTETKTLAKNDIKIFGAIWTAQGLIYVAKLNEKGELELYDRLKGEEK